jgi:SAM-dependent methyltransferase
MTTRLYQFLACPHCGTAPAPGLSACPGCGRSIAARGGGLDLLDDEAREAADRFGAQYTALRRNEGWIGPNGREDPETGEPRLWRRRLESAAAAAAVLSRQGAGVGRPIVADIGSGGGWAVRYVPDADVIAIDLLDLEGRPDVLQVRGDMRRLPLRDGAVDAALYVASFHYAPAGDVIREVARVLRPGGLVIAVDSPMYRDRRAQALARSRSAAYYAGAGFPELAAHYYPIDVAALPAALAGANLEVLRLDPGRTAMRWWERLGRPQRSSFLVAKLMSRA